MNKNGLIHGVGLYEKGKYLASLNSRPTRHYRTWYGMLERCYSGRQPTYIDCYVDPRFYSFQEFMLWAEQQIGFTQDRFALDKDILIKGNKVYSPETCVFVPQEINALFTNTNAVRGDYPIGVYLDKRNNRYRAGVNRNGRKDKLGKFRTIEEAFNKYKKTKEEWIKEVANLFSDVIDPRAYDVMMNYVVEITD